MRQDMRHVIINTSRVGGTAPKGRRSNPQKLKELPEQEGMRRPYRVGHVYKTQSDRLNPVWKYLKNHVGESWDDIWKDICQDNDSRNIRGYHLRDHVKNRVYSLAELQTRISSYYFYGYYSYYYIDSNGILQEWKGRPFPKRKPKEVDRIDLKNGMYLFKKDGFWYMQTVPPKYRTEKKIVGKYRNSPYMVKYYENKGVPMPTETIYVETLYDQGKWHQLSAKELKVYDIKNDNQA